MRKENMSKTDMFYGLWVAIIIGIIVALSINLIYIYQIMYPAKNVLLYVSGVSLVGAAIGIFIHCLQGFIIYCFRDVKNKYIMGIVLFINSYLFTFIITYILGYRDLKILAAISLIPSVYGTIFAHFEIIRRNKLNCGLQKKKEELLKKINLYKEL